MQHYKSETIRILKKYVTLNPEHGDWSVLFEKIQGGIYSDALVMINEGKQRMVPEDKIWDIHNIVAKHFEEIYHKGVTDLTIRTRRREVSEPRFFFFYFAVNYVQVENETKHRGIDRITYEHIGNKINPEYPFDHATVCNGIKKTEELIYGNRKMLDVFEKIKKEVESL